MDKRQVKVCAIIPKNSNEILIVDEATGLLYKIERSIPNYETPYLVLSQVYEGDSIT